MSLRDFAYDSPNYTMVRQHNAGVSDPSASGVNFATFRSRCKVIVNAVTVVITSAASAASAVLTLLRTGSAATTFGMAGGTAGQMTVISCALTLESVGDYLAISSGQGAGEYHVLYEYNVAPHASMYAAY